MTKHRYSAHEDRATPLQQDPAYTTADQHKRIRLQAAILGAAWPQPSD